jgi:hypothetical protein
MSNILKHGAQDNANESGVSGQTYLTATDNKSQDEVAIEA